uniref:Uncharacterized protein n=1 Tax=Cacopsylla melanoneura TaxID=428564 RepID=A0A8D8WF61_9HEMI
MLIIFSMKRREEVSLTRIRIGHTNLTHCFLMKKEPPPVCEVCTCPLTVIHILKHCRKFQSLRNPNDLYSCHSTWLDIVQSEYLSSTWLNSVLIPIQHGSIFYDPNSFLQLD